MACAVVLATSMVASGAQRSSFLRVISASTYSSSTNKTWRWALMAAICGCVSILMVLVLLQARGRVRDCMNIVQLFPRGRLRHLAHKNGGFAVSGGFYGPGRGG